jgi:uncharacterized protein YkwD
VVVVAFCFVVAGVGGGAAYFLWGREQPSKVEQQASNAAEQTPPAASTTQPAKKGPEKPATLPRIDEEKDPVQAALSLVNRQRSKAGVPALKLDPERSRGCQEHALYLAKNLPARPNLDPHAEEDLPGATSAGKAVAARISIVQRPPLDVVTAWLEAPAHRELLLDPARASLGIGFAPLEKGCLSVFDLVGGRLIQAAPGTGDTRAILFPGHRQTEVPVAFPGNEIPDPLPEAKEKLAGYPVTLTFPPRVPIREASARMEDEAGQDVPLWFSTPEKPANPDHARLQRSTVCLFARSPLRHGSRYLVRVEAQVGGQKWSRTWTFATVSAEKGIPLMYQRVIARINEYRKFAGLQPTRLDPERSKACIDHANYLARHLDRLPGIRFEDEREDLPGYTKAGQEISRRAAIRVGGGAGPADALDWMMASILNRHIILNPRMDTIALGVAQHPGAERKASRGWIWVISPPNWRRAEGILATLYPGKDQKDVPIYYGRELGSTVPSVPKGYVAGFAVTTNFFFGTQVRNASAWMIDAGGDEVPCWLSTPQKPLPGTGNYVQILLIPKKPLEPATNYTVKMSATVDGAPWSESWRFTTVDPKREQQEVGTYLCERVNEARKQAGLAPVTIDEKLSRGCHLHARYISRNIDHPRVQGLGIHAEDESLPGATDEGARAGKASVIAVISDPADSVENWLATLYHRIPLLDPNLKRIGYAQVLHPFRGWVTVLDAANGR